MRCLWKNPKNNNFLISLETIRERLNSPSLPLDKLREQLISQIISSVPGAEDRKLFLGGLSWETKEPQLKEYFEKFGEIEAINLKLDPTTGRSRCFAFLVFRETSSIEQVRLKKISFYKLVASYISTGSNERGSRN